MAYIESLSSNEITFLHTKHLFGRKNSAANSSLMCDLVSRNHASIEWNGRRWKIKDLSRNGTWVNNKKLQQNTSVPLRQNDRIHLGNDDGNGVSFEVKSVDKPSSLIYRAHPSLQIIEIEDSNLIPNPMSPDFGLYYCYGRKGWFSQNFSADNDSTDNYEQGRHNYGEEIHYCGNRWTLFLLDQDHASNAVMRQPINSISNYEFQIRFNRDENDIRINLISKEDELELEPKSYTKTLAHLINLQQKSEDGWVSFRHLCKSTGKNQANINLQLFMFRHHLASSLSYCKGISKVIERNPDSLRFGVKDYSIYRDGKLDQSSDYD